MFISMATHETAIWQQDLAGEDRHTAQCISPRIQRLGLGGRLKSGLILPKVNSTYCQQS